MARGQDPNPFGPGLLKFLRGLKRNNDRSWFEAHKDDYEDEVREPALMFIRIMARHVRRISPHLTAKDTRVGGAPTGTSCAPFAMRSSPIPRAGAGCATSSVFARSGVSAARA
jgi:hypothetical protein